MKKPIQRYLGIDEIIDDIDEIAKAIRDLVTRAEKQDQTGRAEKMKRGYERANEKKRASRPPLRAVSGGRA